MNNLKQIIDFIKEETGNNQISKDSDICDGIGIYGDDFHELIDAYAKKFNVDMTNYLWYFHAEEEGYNIGGLFFDPPYKRVKRIPITPQMLTDFSMSGKWSLNYPKHSIPNKRIDLIINRFFFFLAILFLAIWAFTKL
ncbi:conserved protein of unknown function [Tenacibaculum sp. 190130A14a]|uniref:DUF1493 family protein n=1 Tax=Tenacibaculum polynesiense TaxID=3137857 RepID=A0ABM9P7Q4_9FLAO